MPTNLFKAGAWATDERPNIIVLWGHINTSGNVTHLRAPFTTVGYQVTAGKTLYLTHLRIGLSELPGAYGDVKIGYADNDVGLNTATARTNAVMAIGLDDTVRNGFTFHRAPAVAVNGEIVMRDIVLPIAVGGKYPFIRSIASSGTMDSSFLMTGFEA